MKAGNNPELNVADRPNRTRWALALGFVGMFVLMVFLTFVGLRSLTDAQTRLDLITGEYMRKIQLVSEMRNAARERTINLQKMVLIRDRFVSEEQYDHFQRNAGEFILRRQQLEALLKSDKERELLKRQGELTNIAVPLQHQVAEAARHGRYAQAQRLLTDKAIPAQDNVFEVLNELVELEQQRADRALKMANTEYQIARYWLIALSLSTLLLGFLITYLMAREYRRSDRALRVEKERAQVTLHSLAEAVIRTDAHGSIEYMNPVAERLTGWPGSIARGQPLSGIFKILHEATREPAENPVVLAVGVGTAVTDSGDIILLTRGGHEYAIEYSATPAHGEDGNIDGAVVVFRDVTDVRALSRELVHQATHDPMTGMLNRREFENRAQQFLDSCRLAERAGSLFYMDLDLFKAVNDTCGHLAGDELLKQISQLIRRRVRREDVLARMGGDEFAVLLQDCPPDKAIQIANDLRQSIHEFRFVWEDRTIDIGASIGLAHVTADSGDINDVFRIADVACRIAKDEGRNRVHVYQPDDMNVSSREREINWIHRIRHAIQHDGFVLYGQWIRPLAHGRSLPTHCEVLLRLRDGGEEVFMTAAFLSAAERYHLMPSVDRWVVHSVLKALQATAVHGGMAFNINLSGQTLCDNDFLGFVLREIETNGIDPARLCFEITETAAVTHMSRAMTLIEKLREAGCRFALDDFGSGLSSFTYLKNMPIDYLKIDGSFVRNIPDDATDLAMVTSINQVAHIMGIQTIAEYVETDAIRVALAGIGVDYGQGYVLARPVLLDELLDELRERS